MEYTRRIPSIIDAPGNNMQWAPAGSSNHMRIWTFEKGIASFQARAQRYGRLSEVAPLSPKSRLVHIALEEPLASPTTVLNRAPIHGQRDNSQHVGYPGYQDDLRDENVMRAHGVDQTTGARESQLTTCYSCGERCLDKSPRPRPGESPHWFIDVHDGVNRKTAYLMCLGCTAAFIEQMRRPRHRGCGHLPSLSLSSCPQECRLMFCGRCRAEIRQ